LDHLRDSANGERESGGFLLGELSDHVRCVKAFIPYEKVDPGALTGYIVFDGSKMDAVWNQCRESGYRVLADVHTHPRGYRQSPIDQSNPMVPEIGHIAIIVPNYADRTYLPGQIGIYQYLGSRRWIDHSRNGNRVFQLE